MQTGQDDLDPAVCRSASGRCVAGHRMLGGVAGERHSLARHSGRGKLLDDCRGASAGQLPVRWVLRGGDRLVVGVTLDLDRMTALLGDDPADLLERRTPDRSDDGAA
jgi:hypothetical protein